MLFRSADASTSPSTDAELNEVKKRCDAFLSMHDDPTIMHLSRLGLKSHAETAMLLKVLHTMKNDSVMNTMLSSCDRLFKLSCRTILTENFKLSNHDVPGKYVFWKKTPTWMSPPIMNATHSLMTRFYSVCGSLIDHYIGVLHCNIQLLNSGLDTEHAHFVNINPTLLVELPTMGCYGYVAGHGKIEHY